MDKKFDYSEFELGKLTYNFSNLTPEQADEKRVLYEQFLREKEEAKAVQIAAKATPSTESNADETKAVPKRPVFRPTQKPAASSTPPPDKPANSEGSSIEHPLTDATPDEMQQIAQGGLETTKKPVFRPTQKPVARVPDAPVETKQAEPPLPPDPDPSAVEPDKPKSAPFRPTMKPGAVASPKPAEPEAAPPDVQKAKPAAFRPTMKPPKLAQAEVDAPMEVPKPKPAGFRPTMKPAAPTKPTDTDAKSETQASADEDKPVEETENPVPETPMPKPAGFRPTMRPKPKPDDEKS